MSYYYTNQGGTYIQNTGVDNNTYVYAQSSPVPTATVNQTGYVVSQPFNSNNTFVTNTNQNFNTGTSYVVAPSTNTFNTNTGTTYAVVDSNNYMTANQNQTYYTTTGTTGSNVVYQSPVPTVAVNQYGQTTTTTIIDTTPKMSAVQAALLKQQAGTTYQQASVVDNNTYVLTNTGTYVQTPTSTNQTFVQTPTSTNQTYVYGTTGTTNVSNNYTVGGTQYVTQSGALLQSNTQTPTATYVQPQQQQQYIITDQSGNVLQTAVQPQQQSYVVADQNQYLLNTNTQTPTNTYVQPQQNYVTTTPLQTNVVQQPQQQQTQLVYDQTTGQYYQTVEVQPTVQQQQQNQQQFDLAQYLTQSYSDTNNFYNNSTYNNNFNTNTSAYNTNSYQQQQQQQQQPITTALGQTLTMEQQQIVEQTRQQQLKQQQEEEERRQKLIEEKRIEKERERESLLKRQAEIERREAELEKKRKAADEAKLAAKQIEEKEEFLRQMELKKEQRKQEMQELRQVEKERQEQTKEMQKSFFSAIIETATMLATNNARISEVLTENFEEIVSGENIDAEEYYDLVITGFSDTSTRLKDQLTLNLFKIDDSIFKGIEEKANSLFNATVALSEFARRVVKEDKEKFIAMTPAQREDALRQQSLTVIYAIKQLATILEREKFLGDNTLNALNLDEASVAVTTQEEASAEASAPTIKRVAVVRTEFKPTRPLVAYDADKITVLQKFLKKASARASWRNLAIEYSQCKGTHTARIRNKNLFEFLTTEISYVDGLNIIMDYYAKPLRERIAKNKTPVIATKDQERNLFGALDTILEINKKVLADFRERLSKWPSLVTFGDILVGMTPAFKLYVHYVNNYDIAMNTYKDLQAKPEFAAWEAEVQSKLPGNAAKANLTSLMITPIQRLPRYELLLRELIKHTPETHIDLPNLKTAVTKLSEVNRMINAKKQDSENRQRLLVVQNSIINPGIPVIVIAPHRLYVQEALLEFTHKSKKEVGMVYIMNDQLILTQTQIDPSAKQALPLPPSKFKPQNVKSGLKPGHYYIDTVSFKKLVLKDTGKDTFSLVQGKEEYTFTCENEDQKKLIGQCLNDVLASYALNELLDRSLGESTIQSGFILLTALFGHTKSGKTIDVTAKLKQIIQQQGGNQLMLSAGSKKQIFGDPAPKKKKHIQLIVSYSVNGQFKSKIFEDEDAVLLTSAS
eukprot:TRINITY_DN1774_c1_g1_i2.p1 TRINITY_DN1774_c1_g1~~TRINITY_DN1774_c1_g1_i2.p1  ORF type:complete len:1193 (+),score=364.73 TRINITY_DN1774_c1_g1_i2:6-3584(+)